MKFVTLVVAAMIISFSASSQTTRRAADKSTATHHQQKTKSQKAKLPHTKSAADNNDGVITLTDEKAHKAKWTFEEMLKRRLEIDAKEGVTQERRE